MVAQRYWLLIHDPRGRPRTIRPSAASPNRTRVDTPIVPCQVLPSPTGIWCRKRGTSSAISVAVASPSRAERVEGLGLDLGQPSLGIVGDPGSGDELDGRAPLLGPVRPGARRVDDRNELERLDEHRPPHPEHPDDRPLVVQAAPDRFGLGPRVARRHPGHDRQIDRRRVRRVQPDQVCRDLDGPAARAPVARWCRRAIRARRSSVSIRLTGSRYPTARPWLSSAPQAASRRGRPWCSSLASEVQRGGCRCRTAPGPVHVRAAGRSRAT